MKIRSQAKKIQNFMEPENTARVRPGHNTSQRGPGSRSMTVTVKRSDQSNSGNTKYPPAEADSLFTKRCWLATLAIVQAGVNFKLFVCKQ